MASYNVTLGQELAEAIETAVVAAGYDCEDVAFEFVPEFDKAESTDRKTRVVNVTDTTEPTTGTRRDDQHIVTLAVGIWKPLVATIAKEVNDLVPDQVEYAETVFLATRKLRTTIGGVLWEWAISSFEPLYDHEMLRDDSEFMSWIGVQFRGNTP